VPNVDYKIASKAITKRLEKVLTLLINPDQTGFIKGRYIRQNIRLIKEILEQSFATFLVYFYSLIFKSFQYNQMGILTKNHCAI